MYIFEGKVIVTGDIYFHGEYFSFRKSVETYDHYKNKWNLLPELIYGRCNHEVVSMGNKMFAIGGKVLRSCEVFDSFSRKFTLLKRMPAIVTYFIIITL